MHKLTEVRADSDYRLWLRFDDGLEGSVFLGNLLEIGAFKLWRDRDQFRRVAIDPAAKTLGLGWRDRTRSSCFVS